MAEGDPYYFYTSSGLCYFDDYRNVFFEDGALVHDGSFDSESNASFDIDGVLYWFIPDGLLYQDAAGAFYRVPTYAVETEQNPNQLDPSQAPDGLQGPQDDTDALQPSLDNKLDYDLADLLTNTYLVEDSIDLNGGINHNPVRDELPLLKQDLKMRHYFDTPGGVHCFDDDRKLYSEDGKLVYDGLSSLDPQAQDPRIPNFCIDGSAYWFDEKGLSRRDTDGALCRVITWRIDPCGPLDQQSTQDDVAAIQPDPNPESSCGSRSVPKTKTAADGNRNPAKPKTEVPSPDPRYDSLENAFHTGLVSTSPGSSQAHSPNIDTTTNLSQLFGDLSLFLASEPGYLQSARIISRQQLNAVNVQTPTEKAQPARKRGGNKDHLRCPHCGKQCRRPVALSEHLRTHLNEKPEICPFEDCKTGFAMATKSNMRRHFPTHRAGTLEDYALEMAQQPNGIQSRKVTYVPTVPHSPYHPGIREGNGSTRVLAGR